jgi:UPF0176 protein
VDLQKVILFYSFAPVTDPLALKLWQRTLCESLNLKGRIIVSKHGINGTLGGNMEDLKKYARATKAFPGFGKTDYKWSAGTGKEFSKLSVRVRNELVAFTLPDEIIVEKSGITNGGKHLKPAQVNKLVEERGDEVVFFDGRNEFEARIGKFKNAVVPNVQSSHQFVEEIESGKYDHLKEKPIVTYCTGGIRCEILSAVMINRGFKEVYQIDGGIVRYGEKYRDSGLWEGSLFVFDKRMTHNFSDDTKIVGVCEECESPTNALRNCMHEGCKDFFLMCDSCFEQPNISKHNDTHTRGKRDAFQVG